MELVEGRRLSEMPLDVAAGMRVALDLGGAVETLHNMGFIHSALCPHNIMVLEDGRIKLLDLELVGLRDAREIRGVIAAEPPAEYLSPEQILKAPVTDKADIYAFGVILYELLCGVPPFEAATREAVLAKQLKEAPVPIHRRRSNVPGSVQRAVTLALHKQPESRPLMGDVLNLLWTGAHSTAPPRRRVAVIVGGVALAAVAAGAVTWGVLALSAWAPVAPVPTAVPGQAPVSARPPSLAPVTKTRPAPAVTPVSPARPPTAVERAPVAAPPRSPALVTDTRRAPTVAPAPPPSDGSRPPGAPHRNGPLRAPRRTIPAPSSTGSSTLRRDASESPRPARSLSLDVRQRAPEVDGCTSRAPAAAVARRRSCRPRERVLIAGRPGWRARRAPASPASRRALHQARPAHQRSR